MKCVFIHECVKCINCHSSKNKHLKTIQIWQRQRNIEHKNEKEKKAHLKKK